MAKNDSYVAHIVAAEPGGARGVAVRSEQLADNVANLMLMCDTHHREIDDPKLAHVYTEAALLEMKAENAAASTNPKRWLKDHASQPLISIKEMNAGTA